MSTSNLRVQKHRRNLTLEQLEVVDQMKFCEMLQLDHRDYASMQQHALEGGFLDNPENIGKSLQDHKDITLAKSRKVDTTLKISFKENSLNCKMI